MSNLFVGKKIKKAYYAVKRTLGPLLCAGILLRAHSAGWLIASGFPLAWSIAKDREGYSRAATFFCGWGPKNKKKVDIHAPSIPFKKNCQCFLNGYVTIYVLSRFIMGAPFRVLGRCLQICIRTWRTLCYTQPDGYSGKSVFA